MVATNDVTGDELRSKTTSKLYETNYDTIFRKPTENLVESSEVTPDKPMESPSQKETK